MAADRSYSLSGYGGGPDRCVVKVPGIVPGKIPKPASISGKTTKSMVRYEEDASDPTAIWRIATAANHKADRVQQQKGDFQKVMTELHESMDRVEALLRRLVNSQAQTLDQTVGRGVSHLQPSEKSRSVEDLCQINLNSTQGIQLMSTTEGNFKFPSTYPSVVVTGWGEDSNEVDEIQKDESALKGTDAKTKSNDPTEAPSQPVETGDMAQINIISKRGVQIHGIPDGNSNSPSTGYSAVPNCWGQSQLPLVFVASPTLNKLNPNNEPLVEALDSPELVGGEPLVGRADKRLRCTGLFWKLPPWPGFCALVFDRFAQHSDYKVLENSHSVKQYNHSVLNYTVKFEELLNIWPIVNEDYYARVEGWEITSNLSKAAGLATMAAMRPDIDEYVRNTTVRAFSMMTSVLGISALLHLLKAIDFIIPLIDAQYASYYTKEVMQALIREFQSPDEGKKIVLNVVKQCVSTEGVEADYILEQELEPMEQTVVKAKSCNGDGHNVDRKLRQKLEMNEDEAHFHMKQDESSACKYVILSKKVLAVFVVMNSTVSSSKEPGNIVFQTLTDAQNFYAMNLWFAEKARMESLSQFGHLHFLFPEIFKDLNKGVMLGDNVIVQRDLSFLGNLNMGYKVNGTVEFWGVRLDQVRNLLGEITCDSKSCAWMSGVNVTNLDKWRKHDVTEDYLLLLKKFKTKDTELFKENVALCPHANAEKGTTGGNDNQNQTDLFNWEDATEVPAEKLREYGCKHSNTGAEVSKDKYGYYQKKKYRRDFLVKFKQKRHANLSKCVFAASHVDYLGLEMNWDANPSIILDIKIRLGVSLPIQVKDIGFTGVLHLIFRPRVNELPCFGAVCFSLRRKKRLDFTLWVIGGEISVIPGISDALEDTIKNAIEDSITWPVRKVIPIIPGDYSDLELKSVGTVEVNLVQARDLTNKDVIGKSDPFAILYVRPLTDKTKRSKTINNDLNPIWNEYFEFIVEDADTQSTTVKIYDDDGIQELKLQLEVFFSCVVLRLAQSKYGASFQQQEVALEALVDFYRQNEFMAEMYATMDCDLQCSNVFGDIANLISKSAFPVNSPLSALKVLALGGLVVVVQAIAERCYEQSPHMFVNKDVALVLSYSVIMLNTDQKNVRVKKEMTEEDIKNGLVSFDLRQKEITDFFQQCYKWDVLTARSIGAAGPDNQSPNILLDDTLLVEMDKNLFTAVKIQWFNGSICYLKKLLGGMQILSKEYSQSFILRLSNLSFLISILEDKYVVEGKVMSEPEITEELKKCRNSEDNASSSFRVIASDGWDAIWPQWWEINVPDYSPTTARLIVVDYLLLVLITQLNLKLSL